MYYISKTKHSQKKESNKGMKKDVELEDYKTVKDYESNNNRIITNDIPDVKKNINLVDVKLHVHDDNTKNILTDGKN